jgi:hypothetical protein
MTHDLTLPGDAGAASGHDELASSHPGARVLRLLTPPPVLLVYGGVALVGVGFLLLGVTWARVAERLNVALQLPYLVSGGFTGLALVMVGLLAVNIGIRRQDAAERAAESDRVIAALRELTARIDELD